MITFFRKIRKNLLNSGKASRYLAYALGEILLVVIGILIALQIDNWNDQRKARKEADQLLEEVKTNLETDLQAIIPVFRTYNRRDTIARKILKGEYSEEDFREISFLRGLIFNSGGLIYETSAYDALMAKADIFPQDYKELLNELRHTYVVYSAAQGSRENIRKLVLDAFSRYAQKYPWFRMQTQEQIDDAAKYFSSDPLYLNDVYAYHTLASRNYRQSLKHLYTDALMTYHHIREKIGDTTQTPRHIPYNFSGFENKAEKYEGNYIIEESEDQLQISWNGKYLEGRVNGGLRSILTAISPDTLLMLPEWDTVLVRQRASRNVSELERLGYDPFTAVRKEEL